MEEKKRWSLRDFSWDDLQGITWGFFCIGAVMAIAAVVGLVLKLIGVQNVGVIRMILYTFAQEWLNMLGGAGVMMALCAAGYVIDRKPAYGDDKAERVLTLIVSIAVPALITITMTGDIFGLFKQWAYGNKSIAFASWEDLNDLFQMLGMYVLNAAAMIACLQQWRQFISIFELPRVRLLVAVLSLPVYIVVALAIVWFTFRIFGLILAIIAIIFVLAMLGLFGNATTVQDRADKIMEDSYGIALSNDEDAIRYIAEHPAKYGWYNSDVAKEKLEEFK